MEIIMAKQSPKTILVVGGAGFIGSNINKMLNLAGYNTVVFDNLSSGCQNAVTHGAFIKGDMSNCQDLEKVFSTFPIQAVMHFAAHIEVGESVANPAKYYQNNVVNTLNLLNTLLKYSIKTFVFSSSAAIFGTPQQKYINEEHPKNPINPYGETKLIVETILKDYDHAYGLKSSCLRYFNAAGGDPEGKIKNFKAREFNLIPIALRSLIDPSASISIFGTDYPTPDGTCIRDYIHVSDLGAAHIAAMERIMSDNHSSTYNLGNGHGFSVTEVLTAIEKVTGKKLNILIGPRRAGDPPFLVADSQKARRELNWVCKYPSLESMIEHAWQAMR